MRTIIAWEGQKRVSHCLVEIGALHWDATVPIVPPSFGFETIPFAVASDLRREADGSITAEVGEDPRTQNVEATVYATDLNSTWEGKLLVVHYAKIREIFMHASFIPHSSGRV